jgi:sensor histidine kinase regulating citrate/malate metabolism
MVTIPVPTPDDGKIRFDKSVSLGTILQILILLVTVAMAWSTLSERQNVFQQRQQEQQMQIAETVSRQERIAELNARQSASLDALEMRVNRLEGEQDRSRGLDIPAKRR